MSLRNTLIGRAGKRGLDLLLAGTGILLLSPLLMAIAALIKMDGSGPVLFRQQRVGRCGKRFTILKYRTMVVNAEEEGPGITVAEDDRVTHIGRWLRRSKLDELPQLFNVLEGSMSLVGPRPELPRYVDFYTADERAVLDQKPGITDPATLVYRDEEDVLAEVDDPQQHYVDVVMRHKIALNLEYADRATVWTDLGVVMRTISALLFYRRS